MSITPNTPADFTPSMGDYRSLQPFRYWCQKVLPLVYDDSLSYYELLCKVVDYLNKTMEDVETLHIDVDNLHEAYKKLQEYVNNYFSTLDVQEEINKKLDEMANSGFFDTLVAKYVDLFVTPKMLGAVGDGVNDDTQYFKKCVETGKPILITDGVYLITETIELSETIIKGTPGSKILFKPSANNITCFNLSGETGDEIPVSNISRNTITLASTQNFNVGDYVILSSDDKVEMGRDYDTFREINQIQLVSGNSIELKNSVLFNYKTNIKIKVVKMKQVEIDGVNIVCGNFYTESKGINLSYCINSTIKNCCVKEFDYGCITLFDCIQCNISNCTTDVSYSNSLQYGIAIHSCFYCGINNNKSNSKRTAIDVSRVSNFITVCGNTCQGPINTHTCFNVIISSNTMFNGGYIRGNKTTFTNNIVYGGTTLGGYYNSEAGQTGKHIISNNRITGNLDINISINEVIFSNNYIEITESNNFDSCVRLTFTSDDTLFQCVNNTIVNKSGKNIAYGINAYINCSVINNAIFNSNVVKDFSTPMYVYQKTSRISENLIISNNILKSNGNGNCIEIRYTNNVVISGNVLIGNEETNYAIKDESGSTINYKTITGNVIAGVKNNNRIASEQNELGLGGNSFTGEFYDIGKSIAKNPTIVFDENGEAYKIKIVEGQLTTVKL